MSPIVDGGRTVGAEIGEALGGRGTGLSASVRAPPLGVALSRRPRRLGLCESRLLTESGVTVPVVVAEVSEEIERESVGVRRVRPFREPWSATLPFPFFCSGCGVLGVAVCVDVLDSDEVEREGETDREVEAEDDAVEDVGERRDACMRLRLSKTCRCTSCRAVIKSCNAVMSIRHWRSHE